MIINPYLSSPLRYFGQKYWYNTSSLNKCVKIQLNINNLKQKIMKNPVKVATNPKNGLVITPSVKKEGWGQVRFDQEEITLEGGIVNRRNRSAFLNGKLEHLAMLNLTPSKEMPGKIVRTESRIPFFEGQTAKINPTEKKTILIDGAKVYFQDRYTEDLSEQDVLIKGEVTLGETVIEAVETKEALNA